MRSLSVASYLTFTKTLITKLHNMSMAYNHRGVGNKFYKFKNLDNKASSFII